MSISRPSKMERPLFHFRSPTIHFKSVVFPMPLGPRLMLAGMTKRLLLPVSILAQCGIRSPTQPTCPHMETQDAVIIVAARIKISLVFFKSMPLAFASSSLRDRIFSRKRSR